MATTDPGMLRDRQMAVDTAWDQEWVRSLAGTQARAYAGEVLDHLKAAMLDRIEQEFATVNRGPVTSEKVARMVADLIGDFAEFEWEVASGEAIA